MTVEDMCAAQSTSYSSGSIATGVDFFEIQPNDAPPLQLPNDHLTEFAKLLHNFRNRGLHRSSTPHHEELGVISSAQIGEHVYTFSSNPSQSNTVRLFRRLWYDCAKNVLTMVWDDIDILLQLLEPLIKVSPEKFTKTSPEQPIEYKIQQLHMNSEQPHAYMPRLPSLFLSPEQQRCNPHVPANPYHQGGYLDVNPRVHRPHLYFQGTPESRHPNFPSRAQASFYPQNDITQRTCPPNVQSFTVISNTRTTDSDLSTNFSTSSLETPLSSSLNEPRDPKNPVVQVMTEFMAFCLRNQANLERVLNSREQLFESAIPNSTSVGSQTSPLSEANMKRVLDPNEELSEPVKPTSTSVGSQTDPSGCFKNQSEVDAPITSTDTVQTPVEEAHSPDSSIASEPPGILEKSVLNKITKSKSSDPLQKLPLKIGLPRSEQKRPVVAKKMEPWKFTLKTSSMLSRGTAVKRTK